MYRYAQFNDAGDDLHPLQVAVANVEGVKCGMADPAACVRVDKISAYRVSD
jgi:hypothetical protein